MCYTLYIQLSTSRAAQLRLLAASPLLCMPCMSHHLICIVAVLLSHFCRRLVIPPDNPPYKSPAKPSPSGWSAHPQHHVSTLLVFHHQKALTTLPKKRFSTAPAGDTGRPLHVTPVAEAHLSNASPFAFPNAAGHTKQQTDHTNNKRQLPSRVLGEHWVTMYHVEMVVCIGPCVHAWRQRAVHLLLEGPTS
jgi:hypothetical protein